MAIIKPKSPNVQMWILAGWPTRPTNGGSAAAFISAYDQPYTVGGSQTCRAFYEKILTNMQADHPTIKAPLILPYGPVLYEINKKMASGSVSGYQHVWQLFQDEIHLNNQAGSYICCLTAYAAIYYRDPRGTGVPSSFGTIQADLLSVIQQAVYDIVFGYKYTNGSYTGSTPTPTD
jgi:hypothetical protein